MTPRPPSCKVNAGRGGHGDTPFVCFAFVSRLWPRGGVCRAATLQLVPKAGVPAAHASSSSNSNSNNKTRSKREQGNSNQQRRLQVERRPAGTGSETNEEAVDCLGEVPDATWCKSRVDTTRFFKCAANAVSRSRGGRVLYGECEVRYYRYVPC